MQQQHFTKTFTNIFSTNILAYFEIKTNLNLMELLFRASRTFIKYNKLIFTDYFSKLGTQLIYCVKLISKYNMSTIDLVLKRYYSSSCLNVEKNSRVLKK